MADLNQGFSAEAVALFIIEKGGKISTGEVARHFRKYLLDEDNQEKNKALFRDYVNAVAVLKRIENEKVLVIKPEWKKDLNSDSESARSTPCHEMASLGSSLESLPVEDSIPAEQVHVINNDIVGTEDPSTSPIKKKRENGNETMKETEYMEANDQQIPMPVAPPRRRHSEKRAAPPAGADTLQTKSEGGDKENEPKISVKAQAQKINKQVSDSQLVPALSLQEKPKKSARETKFDKQIADDYDTASVISINPTTKEWMVIAAKADYIGMTKLLKENPKLAKYKDFISGYTALHWAAKHGNSDIVKLIAGTHGADVNIRSHGGYTPLHLAAMHKRKTVYEILLSTYKADRSMRDYSGKRAEEYWPRQATGSHLTKPESRKNSRASNNISDSEENTSMRHFSILGINVVSEAHRVHSKSRKSVMNSKDAPSQQLAHQKSDGPSRVKSRRPKSESFLRLHRPNIHKRPKTSNLYSGEFTAFDETDETGETNEPLGQVEKDGP